jgi:hypothetical protein
MIKALFLIFEPLAAWDRVALSRRGLLFIVTFYLLPMMLIVAALQGYSLVEWGRWQADAGAVKKFTPGEAAVFEAMELLLMGAVIALCAHMIKALSETFRGGQTYTQAFKVVIYGLSPVFLFRLLDAVPSMNLWVPWIMGMMLCIKILYIGVPRVMQPDPPHAFGLFVMSSLLLTMVTGLERYLTASFLAGHFKSVEQVISHIASWLPFLK